MKGSLDGDAPAGPHFHPQTLGRNVQRPTATSLFAVFHRVVCSISSHCKLRSVYNRRRLESVQAAAFFSIPQAQKVILVASTSENRLYYMDSLRAVAMFLGLVLHAAVVFEMWAYDPLRIHYQPSAALHYIMEMIHVFRM